MPHHPRAKGTDRVVVSFPLYTHARTYHRVTNITTKQPHSATCPARLSASTRCDFTREPPLHTSFPVDVIVVVVVVDVEAKEGNGKRERERIRACALRISRRVWMWTGVERTYYADTHAHCWGELMRTSVTGFSTGLCYVATRSATRRGRAISRKHTARKIRRVGDDDWLGNKRESQMRSFDSALFRNVIRYAFAEVLSLRIFPPLNVVSLNEQSIEGKEWKYI